MPPGADTAAEGCNKAGNNIPFRSREPDLCILEVMLETPAECLDLGRGQVPQQSFQC